MELDHAGLAEFRVIGMGIEAGIFGSLGWIVVAAAAFALLARVVRLPAIVAYLVAGLAIGPGLGLVEPSAALELISEVGIVLLLFLVGLELSFDKIREVGAVALAAGLGQVVFTALGGLLFCWLLGFSMLESLFLAVALTFSSTVVVVKILTDKNELDSLYGRIAVGIFLVQDLVVILVLTVLTGLRGGVDGAGVALGIVKAFGGMGLLLGVVLVASRFVLPRPFAWVASSPASLLVWSLAWCFGIVALAHHLELSVELGAFFAGLSLAQLPYNRDLQYRIKPLMNFFVAVFFVSLGLGMAPGSARAEWLPILALSLFVLLGNPLIFMLIISRMGFGERTAFFTSVTVAQISEFSFVFVAMGAAAGLVGERVLAVTAMVGVITMAVSAYMILYNRPLFEWVRARGLLRPFRAPRDDARADTGAAPPEGHVIVVGMNSLGRALVEGLHRSGEQVLAIDTDARKLHGLPCRTLLGSTEYLDVLVEAGLPRAKLLVSALRIEEANELLAYRCRQFGVPCSSQAVDMSMVDNLLELGVGYLMLPKVDGVKLQNRLLRERGILAP
jgi:Kef-type K+ transport system membrane component KefB